MSADLEREAREAAEEYRVSCSLDAVGYGQLTHEVIGYAQGFFDAATLREKEIEGLKAHLERANSAATANVPWNAMLHLFRLVSNAQISARKAFELAQALVHGGMSEAELPYLLSGEPMTGDGDKDSEIATLRAMVAELEGMVPKWVPTLESMKLFRDGWKVVPLYPDVPGYILFCPPIPVPETKP